MLLLVFFRADGLFAWLIDIPAERRRRAANVRRASRPGGHFFPDVLPKETSDMLTDFLNATV